MYNSLLREFAERVPGEPLPDPAGLMSLGNESGSPPASQLAISAVPLQGAPHSHFIPHSHQTLPHPFISQSSQSGAAPYSLRTGPASPGAEIKSADAPYLALRTQLTAAFDALSAPPWGVMPTEQLHYILTQVGPGKLSASEWNDLAYELPHLLDYEGRVDYHTLARRVADELQTVRTHGPIPTAER